MVMGKDYRGIEVLSKTNTKLWHVVKRKTLEIKSYGLKMKVGRRGNKREGNRLEQGAINFYMLFN